MEGKTRDTANQKDHATRKPEDLQTAEPRNQVEARTLGAKAKETINTPCNQEARKATQSSNKRSRGKKKGPPKASWAASVTQKSKTCPPHWDPSSPPAGPQRFGPSSFAGPLGVLCFALGHLLQSHPVISP